MSGYLFVVVCLMCDHVLARRNLASLASCHAYVLHYSRVKRLLQKVCADSIVLVSLLNSIH